MFLLFLSKCCTETRGKLRFICRDAIILRGYNIAPFVCRIDELRPMTFSKKQYIYYSIYQYSLQMTTILCYRTSMHFTFHRNLGDQQPWNMDCHKQFNTELQTACRCRIWQSVDYGVFLLWRNVLCTQVSTTTYMYKYVYLCVQRTSEKNLQEFVNAGF